MLLIYIQVQEPNEKATHVKVTVRHSNKVVRLDVDTVRIARGMVSQSFSIGGQPRKSASKLLDMPRLAPKKFKEACDTIKSNVVNRNLDSEVWSMIREAAKESDVYVPENGVMNYEIA